MRTFLFLILFTICNLTFAAKTDTVELNKINENAWIHTTYKNLNGYPFPSNGLVVKTSAGIVLIDTPWNDGQTESLLKILNQKFNQTVILTIITHAHDDRIGGIAALIKNRIRTISSKLTAELAVKLSFPSPESIAVSDTNIRCGTSSIDLFYPGPGHTKDNIVVYIEKYKILFGGCLVKSMNSENLGNTVDSDIPNWSQSIKNVQKKFKNATTIIPGHGKCGGTELLSHTLKLLETYK